MNRAETWLKMESRSMKRKRCPAWAGIIEDIMRLFIASALILAAAGCSGGVRSTAIRTGQEQGPAAIGVVQVSAMPTIFHLAQGLVSQLEANARSGILEGNTVAVTTSVSIDDLTETSRFGRLLSEAIGSELFRHGAEVKEIRNTGSLNVVPLEGELALSRRAKLLADEVDASAVLVGTYGLTDSSVVVNIRLVDMASGRICSVAMAEIARTSTIESMLSPEGLGSGLSAMPSTFDRLQQ